MLTTCALKTGKSCTIENHNYHCLLSLGRVALVAARALRLEDPKEVERERRERESLTSVPAGWSSVLVEKDMSTVDGQMIRNGT